jgi:hypothetical protein
MAKLSNRGGVNRARILGRTILFKTLPVIVLITTFVVLFLSFEVLHPIADLLRARGQFVGAITGPAGSQGPCGSGDPVRDAHGPFVSSSPPSLPVTAGPGALAALRISFPAEPFLEPSSPIPISPPGNLSSSTSAAD